MDKVGYHSEVVNTLVIDDPDDLFALAIGSKKVSVSIPSYYVIVEFAIYGTLFIGLGVVRIWGDLLAKGEIFRLRFYARRVDLEFCSVFLAETILARFVATDDSIPGADAIDYINSIMNV